MDQKPGPSSEDFFGSVASSGCIVAFIFFVVFVVNSCVRDDYYKVDLQYKQGVFHGAMGKTLALDAPRNEVFIKGKSVGAYFHDAAEAKIEFRKSVLYLLRASEVTAGDGKALVEWLKQAYAITDPIPLSIFDAGKNYQNTKFSEEELLALKLAAEGKGGAPEWYAAFNVVAPWASWWLFFLIVQSAAFLAFVICVSGKGFAWYRFPWNEAWPYAGLLLLMPGGMPLLLVFGGGVFLMRAGMKIKTYSEEVKKPAGFEGADLAIQNSRKRLEQIQQRLKNGKVA